jgi:WD40 repeat protein
MSTARWLASLAAFLVTAHVVQAQVLQRRHIFKVFDKPVNQVAVSADGKAFAAALNQVDTTNGKRCTEFRIWDTRSQKELASFQEHTDDSAALALSPQGDMLASSTFRGQTLVRSIKDQRERIYSNRGSFGATLGFSNEGSRLGIASEDSIMLVTVSGDEVKTIKYRGRPYFRAFSPDLRLLACGFHQDVDLLDTATGKLYMTLPDHPGSVGFIAFSGDGKTLAAIASTYDEEERFDTQILVWDLAKQSVRARLKSHGFGTSLGIGGDAKFVILLTDKHLRAYAHELKVIDISSGRSTSSIRFEPDQTPQCQAFSRDCKVVAIGCYDGSVHVFDVK